MKREDDRNGPVIYSTNDILSIVTKAKGQLRGQENDIIYIFWYNQANKDDCSKDSWTRGAKLQQEMEYQIKKSALSILWLL